MSSFRVSRGRRALHHRRGANAIEFALCMPVWVLAVSSIFDFGWLVFSKTTLDAATNEGCRAASFIDPGETWDNLAEIEDVATTRTIDAVERLSLQPCPSCSVTVQVIDTGPDTLRCEAVRTVEPVVGLSFGTRELRSVQAAYFQWQHGS